MTTDSPQTNLQDEQQRGTPFQNLMGYRLEVWSPDYAALHYTIRPEHLNRTGRLHGGVLATLLDSACGYAGCFSAVPGERRTGVTLSLTVNYLASTNAGTLLVEARRIGGGKSVFFAEATVKDAEGNLLATASGSFKYLLDRKAAS